MVPRSPHRRRACEWCRTVLRKRRTAGTKPALLTMSLFGDGRSDERRRRVLTEDVISGTAKSGVRSSSETATRTGGKATRNRYAEAARMERRTRITDLIPQSYGAVALWFVLGAALVAGLEALHHYADRLPFAAADGRIAAFDLTGRGSLASWFSALLLQLATAAALVVYSIRKHRSDDYHARYRIWIVAACCWFVGGIDVAASLHEGFQGLMIAVTGNRLFGDGAIWWLGGYAIVPGLVGLRLLFDMKECRSSTAVFLLSGGCYVAAGLASLQLLPPVPGVDAVLLDAGLALAGHLLLVTSMTLHARYVVLEASGELIPRAAKPKAEKSKGAKESTDNDEPKRSMFGWLRKAKIDPPHGTPAPAGRTSDLEPATSGRVPSSAFRPTTETYEASSSRAGVKKVQADFSDDEDDDRRDNRKLSKAERKNLRRQKDFERRYGLSDE